MARPAESPPPRELIELRGESVLPNPHSITTRRLPAPVAPDCRERTSEQSKRSKPMAGQMPARMPRCWRALHAFAKGTGRTQPRSLLPESFLRRFQTTRPAPIDCAYSDDI